MVFSVAGFVNFFSYSLILRSILSTALATRKTACSDGQRYPAPTRPEPTMVSFFSEVLCPARRTALTTWATLGRTVSLAPSSYKMKFTSSHSLIPNLLRRGWSLARIGAYLQRRLQRRRQYCGYGSRSLRGFGLSHRSRHLLRWRPRSNHQLHGLLGRLLHESRKCFILRSVSFRSPVSHTSFLQSLHSSPTDRTSRCEHYGIRTALFPLLRQAHRLRAALRRHLSLAVLVLPRRARPRLPRPPTVTRSLSA